MRSGYFKEKAHLSRCAFSLKKSGPIYLLLPAFGTASGISPAIISPPVSLFSYGEAKKMNGVDSVFFAKKRGILGNWEMRTDLGARSNFPG